MFLEVPIIYLSLLINIIISLDYFIIKSGWSGLFSFFYFPIVGLIGLIYYGIGHILNYFIEISDTSYFSIFGLIYLIILINNFIFTLLLKSIKYKNSKKYFVFTLYYIQSNIIPISFMLFLYLGKIG